MYQFRITWADDPQSFHIVTLLQEGEVYSMVVPDEDGTLKVEPCRFGGSSRGLVASGGASLVTREHHPQSGSLKDYEQHIDGANFWDWLVKWLHPETGVKLDYPITEVIATIRNGEPVAASYPKRERKAA